MKKRNSFTMGSLLMVLAVLIVVYFVYNKSDTSKDTGDTNTSLEENIAVATIDTDKVNSVHYIGKDVDINLILDNDSWISEDDPLRPINQSYVINMINLVEKIDARRIISENGDNLNEYGLDNPSAYLKLTMEDGTSLTLRIGDKSTGINGNYGMVNEDNKVYLLNPTYGAGLEYRDIDFTAIESKPEIEGETIEHIQVINRDGDDFELYLDEDNEYNLVNSSISNWVLIKPYEVAYVADTSKVTEVQEDYTDFSFQSCVDYIGDSLGKYGLEDPASSIYVQYLEANTETLEEPETDPNTGEEINEKVTYENKEYTLYIGDKVDESNYYVRREGSDYVYTMRASLVDQMINRESFEVLNPLILIPNIENVNSIDIEIEGTAYRMEIKRTNTTNEEGEEELTEIYYINNKELEEENFKKVYRDMISASYDAEIKEEIKPDNTKPYLTIKYNLKDVGNNSGQVSFLPYDDSFYLVDTGNKIQFFADKRQIDSIVQSIKDIVG